jgi:hypothetical protein
VSSAGLRPKSDCSGKAQKQLHSNLQTCPLVREGSTNLQNRKCLKEISRRKKNWSRVPDGHLNVGCKLTHSLTHRYLEEEHRNLSWHLWAGRCRSKCRKKCTKYIVPFCHQNAEWSRNIKIYTLTSGLNAALFKINKIKLCYMFWSNLTILRQLFFFVKIIHRISS